MAATPSMVRTHVFFDSIHVLDVFDVLDVLDVLDVQVHLPRE